MSGVPGSRTAAMSSASAQNEQAMFQLLAQVRGSQKELKSLHREMRLRQRRDRRRELAFRCQISHYLRTINRRMRRSNKHGKHSGKISGCAAEGFKSPKSSLDSMASHTRRIRAHGSPLDRPREGHQSTHRGLREDFGRCCNSDRPFDKVNGEVDATADESDLRRYFFRNDSDFVKEAKISLNERLAKFYEERRDRSNDATLDNHFSELCAHSMQEMQERHEWRHPERLEQLEIDKMNWQLQRRYSQGNPYRGNDASGYDHLPEDDSITEDGFSLGDDDSFSEDDLFSEHNSISDVDGLPMDDSSEEDDDLSEDDYFSELA